MSSVPGKSYTIHYRSDSRLNNNEPPRRTEWTAMVLVTDRRGRMNIVSGAAPGVFATGDYWLFDTSGGIVVKPEAKTFSNPMDALTGAHERLRKRVTPSTANDLEWSVDTVAGTDSVAGYATTHLRARITSTMQRSDAECFAMPNPRVTTTTDYWVAKVPGLPANAMAPVYQNAGVSAMQPAALGAAWDSIHSRVRAVGTPLRSVTAIRAVAGPGEATSTTEITIDRIADVQVEESQLVLPDGFTPQAPGGSGAVSRGDAELSKWRRPPRAND
jgi:hypothetical protein